MASHVCQEVDGRLQRILEGHTKPRRSAERMAAWASTGDPKMRQFAEPTMAALAAWRPVFIRIVQL